MVQALVPGKEEVTSADISEEVVGALSKPLAWHVLPSRVQHASQLSCKLQRVLIGVALSRLDDWFTKSSYAVCLDTSEEEA